MGITRDSFLVFPTPLLFYALLGGIGAALSGGVVDGVALALADGVGDGDGGWKVRSAEGEVGGQVELMSRRFQGLKLIVASICHRGKSVPIF